MESAGWARVASARDIPYVVVRAVTDTADEDLPAYLSRCYDPEGGIRRGRVLLARARETGLDPQAPRDAPARARVRRAPRRRSWSIPRGSPLSQEDRPGTRRLDELLEKTSRTFALSIPVLPEPTRREVMIAYLLFRIADTFEDAAHWSPEDRIAALADFRGAARGNTTGRGPRAVAEAWVAREVALWHRRLPGTSAGARRRSSSSPSSPSRPAPYRRSASTCSAPRAAWPSIVVADAPGELTLHSIRRAPRLLLPRRRHRRRDADRALLRRSTGALADRRFPSRARGDLRRGAPARQHPEGLRRQTRRRAGGISRRRRRFRRSSRSRGGTSASPATTSSRSRRRARRAASSSSPRCRSVSRGRPSSGSKTGGRAPRSAGPRCS